MKIDWIAILIITFLFLLSGCQEPEPDNRKPIPNTTIAKHTNDETPTSNPSTAPNLEMENMDIHNGFTYQNSDGNRIVNGRFLPLGQTFQEIELESTPVWLAGTADDMNSYWAAVMEDGSVQGFKITHESETASLHHFDPLPQGMPPVLVVKNRQPELLSPPSGDASFLTHPILLPGSNTFVYISQNGDIVINRGEETSRLAVNALPDARLLFDDMERILLLSKPTHRYTHSVLGDDLEASQITLISTQPDIRILNEIQIEPPQVIEGIAPIWTDINQDGFREIIVTLSDAQIGARIVIFNEDGSQMAASPAIGKGYRWRHQIAAGPFGPEGEIELADVLTPHLGGTIEFFRLQGDNLVINTVLGGYTSHKIGSRNLDTALAVDVDSDDQAELILPNQEMNALGIISHQSTNAQVDQEIPINGEINTNLSAVMLPGSRLIIGLGTKENRLLLWRSE